MVSQSVSQDPRNYKSQSYPQGQPEPRAMSASHAKLVSFESTLPGTADLISTLKSIADINSQTDQAATGLVVDSGNSTNSYFTQAIESSATEIENRQIRRDGRTFASTAQIPSSTEEVSAMPGRGNGCIFKSKNKNGKAVWKIEVTIGYGLNGKRIRTRRTAQTFAAAREVHRQLVSELHKGDLRTKSTETVEDYALWWLRTVKVMSVRPSTLSDYEDRLRRNILPYFGKRRLHEVGPRDIETWLHEMQRTGRATPTINGARQVLNAVFRHAVLSGLVPKNPVEITQRAKRQYGDRTFVQPPWSLAEAQRVLEVTQGTKFDLFTRLGILLGARRGEILALQWSDIDFVSGSIAIERSIRQERVFRPDGSTGTSLVVADTKSTSSRRKLALTAELLASILRHRELVHRMRSQSRGAWRDTPWVFVDSKGGMSDPNNYAKQFKGFLKNEGIRSIRIHDMRHTAAVLSLEAGVRLEAVSQSLGHSRIDITKSVYAPYVQPLMTEFAFGLAEYVSPVNARTLLAVSDLEVKS